MKVNDAIFRDYDIRGIVGEDLNEEFARVFGCAFGTYLVRKGTTDCFVVYDARETSEAYYNAAIEGLISAGVNVLKAGLATTPMMYWARKYYKIDGGLAITASHNPPEYNGFKPCEGNGAMFGEGLQRLKKLMIDEDFEKGQGKVFEKSIASEYFADISRRVSLARRGLARLKVIVDCGNSTAGPFAPALLEKLGVKVEKLFCDIDFAQPNHPPDPVDPRAYPQIQEKIKESKYDCGILFDGDADRLGIIDSEGNIVRGDQITALCARKILKEKPRSLILFEVQCSKSATDDVEANGGKSKLIRVGHSYIEEALHKEKAELAGETSGHIFFADRWYGFDDAMYAASRFLEYVAESGKSVAELVDSLPKYVSTPQTRIFAPDNRKFEIIEELKQYFHEMASYSSSESDVSSDESRSSQISSRQARTIGKASLRVKTFKVLTIDGARLEWEDGWVVVRASNTQPQLTLRAEAMSDSRLEEIKKVMEEAIAPYEKEGVKVEWGKVH